MTKDEARLVVMSAISTALKNQILQQGFEIICKNLSELEKKNAELKELIEDIYNLIPASHSDYYKDVMERARQFLKE